MSTAFAEIEKTALSLSPNERVALAESMLDSVTDEECLSTEAWDAAWKQEIANRLDRHNKGLSSSHSWQSVDNEMTRMLDDAR